MYAVQPQSVVAEDEDRALRERLTGQAATWNREVQMGARGRGRFGGRSMGRGRAQEAVAPYYVCRRCGEMGAHWVKVRVNSVCGMLHATHVVLSSLHVSYRNVDHTGHADHTHRAVTFCKEKRQGRCGLRF